MSNTYFSEHIDDHLMYALPTVDPEVTFFAPAGRDCKEEILRQSLLIECVPLLRQTLDAMPDMVMLLNGNRQIISANAAFLSVLNTSIGKVVDRRPGEAIGCIRSKEGPDGCGSSQHCATCGAVDAILECKNTGKKVVRECRIMIETTDGVTPLNLKVTASTFDVDKDRFILLVAEDVSLEKRLEVLQRTFFHDVLNAAGCIQGYAEYLVSESSSDQEVCKRLVKLSDQIINEIQSQRDLLHAENGDLIILAVPLRTRQIIDDLHNQYLKHQIAEDRIISIKEAWEGTIITDRTLLMRVLGNMLKNALEATPPGGMVTLECLNNGGSVTFAVHNSEIMPMRVQLQVFQRAFSTKNQAGRGIGTYSMKLFGERYLGAKVDFVSTEPEGTTFRLTIPKKFPH